MTNFPSDNQVSRISVRSWAAAVFAAAVLVFSGTLSNPFILDDVTVIRNNPIVQESGRAFEVFTTDYWGMRLDPGRFRDRLGKVLAAIQLAVDCFGDAAQLVVTHLV